MKKERKEKGGSVAGMFKFVYNYVQSKLVYFVMLFMLLKIINIIIIGFVCVITVIVF